MFSFNLLLGFALGGFFSMMSSSFAYEDPLLRQNLNTKQKTVEIFKDMGRGMWKSGKGFGKVGALYSGIECAIESVRG
jgi:import inner membrane translocase subunit TIM22